MPNRVSYIIQEKLYEQIFPLKKYQRLYKSTRSPKNLSLSPKNYIKHNLSIITPSRDTRARSSFSPAYILQNNGKKKLKKKVDSLGAQKESLLDGNDARLDKRKICGNCFPARAHTRRRRPRATLMRASCCGEPSSLQRRRRLRRAAGKRKSPFSARLRERDAYFYDPRREFPEAESLYIEHQEVLYGERERERAPHPHGRARELLSDSSGFTHSIFVYPEERERENELERIEGDVM